MLTLTGCADLLQTGSSDIVKAIPTNAAFIVKVGHPDLLQEALADKPYADIVREKLLLPAMMANHAAISAFLHHAGYVDSATVVPMVASIHLESALQMNSLHYYPLSVSTKSFKKTLADKFPSAALQQWNYEGVDFNEVLIPGNESKLTLAFSEGLLIASPVSFLVEDAVKQLKSSESLLADEGFKKVYHQETDDAAANIWFPFQNARHWISLFAEYGSAERLNVVGEFASWMLLDVYLNEEDIFLSGITSAEKGTRLSKLGANMPCKHFWEELLPYNTACYFHYADMQDSLSASLESMGLGKCWSKLLIEPLNTSLQEHWIYLFEIKSRDLWEEKARTKELTASFFRKQLLKGQRAFFDEAENYIAVASSQQYLNNYLGNLENGQVLSGDESFKKLSESLNTNAQVTMYFRTIYNRESFRSIYESDAKADEDFDALKGFHQISFQFSRQRDILQTTAYLTYSEDQAVGHSNLAWVAALDAPVLAGPVALSIDSKNNQGVLVQDTDFNLYLLDHAGAVLWKKDLGSKWLGDAYSLSLFNDNAVQITLNTETDWHLWDAAGKALAGFPLHFKANATTGMALYRNGTASRAFFALSNGNLYGYEMNGKPLPGWNPQEKVGKMDQSIQIAMEGKTPYVTAFTADGTAYIWDMNGKRKAKNIFKKSFPSAHFIDGKADPFKLKNVGSDGELVSINLGDKVGRYQLDTRQISSFFMGNISGNTEPEIVLSNGRDIYVFSYTGQLVWKKSHTGIIAPVNVENEVAERISVFDPENGVISILNPAGDVLFKTTFSVGEFYTIAGNELLGTGHPALITSGSENEVYCYRISIGSN